MSQRYRVAYLARFSAASSSPLSCLLLSCCFLLTSCGMDREENAKSAPAGWPAVLHYNLSLGTETPESRAHRVELLQKYLENRLGMPVEITTSTNYGGTIEAMRAHKVDAASMGPFAYLIASEKAGAEAIVTRGSPSDGSAGDYAGTLAVAADSPIQSIDEVIRRSKDLTISFCRSSLDVRFPGGASLSGFLGYRSGAGLSESSVLK
jgi:phosphate/phosphite/phosphonate ABC transporter binding protein